MKRLLEVFHMPFIILETSSRVKYLLEAMLLYPWFKWNGVQCDTYGMHVLTTPSVVAASERATTQEIPGRSGTLTLLEGDGVYDEVTLGVTCIIDDPFSASSSRRKPVRRSRSTSSTQRCRPRRTCCLPVGGRARLRSSWAISRRRTSTALS